MKTTHILSALLVTMLIASCGQGERTSAIPFEDTIAVTLMPLQKSGSTAVIEATGIFTTDDETLLGFKNGGIISKIHVKEGNAVRKGQRLASVQAAEIDARAGQAQVALEKAERDYERAKKLYLDSVATLEQMQNAKSALEVARQDVQTVTYNQQHLHIISPVSGFVLARLANEGQVVGPGTPVLHVNGAGNGKWMLKVGVSDSQWAIIQPGDEANISTDALPHEYLQAFVSKKSEALDPQSGTFTIYLELRERLNGKLAAGVFGKSTIRTRTNDMNKNWRIPFESLIDASGKEGYIFITKDGKTAMKQKITIGNIEKDHVEVTSGLEDVEAIIVSGSPYLTDGATISIKN